MKYEKLLLMLSIFGILILILLLQITTPTYIGEIKSIQSSNNKITIQIENSSTKLILFDTTFINLKEGDIIGFRGRPANYKNQSQIIINRIKKLSQNKNKP